MRVESRAAGHTRILDTVTTTLGFEHTHGPMTTLLVGGSMGVLGTYGAWLLADVLPRPVTFLAVAICSGYLTYARPSTRGVLVRGLYGLSILLVVTPVWLSLSMLVLPYGTEGLGDPVDLVFTTADLVFLVAFGGLAAIPAGMAAFIEWRR